MTNMFEYVKTKIARSALWDTAILEACELRQIML